MKVKKEEIKQWINDVYIKLRELFSLYEETDGFRVAPKEEAEEPHDFISRKIQEIRNIELDFLSYMDEQEVAELKESEPRLMMIDPLVAVTRADREVREVFDKLHGINSDAIYFLNRHIEQRGTVGAVFLWNALNPHLNYFDCVFDLVEQYPETYREMGVQGGQFVHVDAQMRKSGEGFYFPLEFPSPERVAERNAYFEKMKERNERENLNWSKNRFFQEELLNTLNLLFERTFEEYL